MGYCSWCQRLSGAKCARCGSKTRAPKDDDPVLLAALDTQGTLLVQEKGEQGRLLRIPAIAPDGVRW